jgi:hypothetical protein
LITSGVESPQFAATRNVTAILLLTFLVAQSILLFRSVIYEKFNNRENWVDVDGTLEIYFADILHVSLFPYYPLSPVQSIGLQQENTWSARVLFGTSTNGKIALYLIDTCSSISPVSTNDVISSATPCTEMPSMHDYCPGPTGMGTQ